MTPEGKVKAAISRVIADYKKVYKFMPVPSGYGPSSLDYILCVEGRFVAIEAKAPGRKPTPRQKAIIGAIERAGGIVFVIDEAYKAEEELRKFLAHASSDSVQQKPRRYSRPRNCTT